MNTHKCIKPACDNSYKSEDVEAYYCESCVKANKILAGQIDAQIAARPSKRKAFSAVQHYEEQLKASK